MQNELNITLRKLEASDIAEKEFPVSPENRRFTKSYIKDWYFQNTTGSFSFWVAIRNNEVKGYLTTKNFCFLKEGKNVTVSIPQNGYVAEEVRGKGLFIKLFEETERENLDDSNVDFFLAFANKKSAGILLNKLNYMRAGCPDLLISLFNPVHFFKPPFYRKLKSIGDINFTGTYRFENSLIKEQEYYHWRYKNYDEKHIHILEVGTFDKPIGYAIILLAKKKGIQFMMLSDIVCYEASNIETIFKEARHYATRSFSSMLVAYRLQGMKSKSAFCFSIKNRFNFLVKGKTHSETSNLSKQTYNLFLGDMDFI